MNTKSTSMMKRLWNEDDGGNAVEYGLVTAVIAVALIGALFIFKEELVGMFTRAGTNVRGAT